MIKYKTVFVKKTVLEELEQLNIICVIRNLNKYFNYHHGYDRGLHGLTADDFSIMVLEKIITGERSWLKSTKSSFMSFCYDAMKSEISNYRNSFEYKNVVNHDFSFEKEDRWTRNGLQDEFDGF